MAKKGNANVNLTTSTDLKVAGEGEQVLSVICIEIAFANEERAEHNAAKG